MHDFHARPRALSHVGRRIARQMLIPLGILAFLYLLVATVTRPFGISSLQGTLIVLGIAIIAAVILWFIAFRVEVADCATEVSISDQEIRVLYGGGRSVLLPRTEVVSASNSPPDSLVFTSKEGLRYTFRGDLFEHDTWDELRQIFAGTRPISCDQEGVETRSYVYRSHHLARALYWFVVVALFYFFARHQGVNPFASFSFWLIVGLITISEASYLILVARSPIRFDIADSKLRVYSRGAQQPVTLSLKDLSIRKSRLVAGGHVIRCAGKKFYVFPALSDYKDFVRTVQYYSTNRAA